MPLSYGFSLGAYGSPVCCQSEKFSEERIPSAFSYPSASYWGSYWQGALSYTHKSFIESNAHYDSLLQRSFFSLNASTTDVEGNLYWVGKDKSPHFPYSVKDSIFSSLSGSGVSFDAFVAKSDVEGRLQWLMFYGSSAYDEACVVHLNSKNELYVAGSISQALYPHDSVSMFGFYFHYSFFTDLYPTYFKY